MQPKTKTYDAHTTADNSNRNDLLLNSSNGNEKDRLTYQEKELYKALCHESANTLRDEAIKDCLQRFDRTGNRELFIELSMSLASQLRDNPVLMLKIIGENAVNALKDLSHRRLVNTPVVSTTGSFLKTSSFHSSR